MKNKKISTFNKKDLCQIDSCKYFTTCNKIQIKGKEVKCINYESIFVNIK